MNARDTETHWAMKEHQDGARVEAAAQRLCEYLALDARPWSALDTRRRHRYLEAVRDCCRDLRVYWPLETDLDAATVDRMLADMGHAQPDARARIEDAARGLHDALSEGGCGWSDLPVERKALIVMIVGEEARGIRPAEEPRGWFRNCVALWREALDE